MVTRKNASKNPLYLAIDQGGHSSRAIAFDKDGQVVAKAKQKVGVYHPQPDWVEQDAEALVSSVESAISDVIAKLGPSQTDVVAAGLATQRSNVVCWNKKTGEALSPVISWQDRRAHHWLEQFYNENGFVHRTTGLPITAHYGASKLKWCLDNLSLVQQALEDKTLAWGPLASFLSFRLTGNVHNLVDPANAARTLLWNIKTRQWDEKLLALFGVPGEPLPKCVPTIYDYGNLVLCDDKIPLTVVTGDQSAAFFAYGDTDNDIATINMGTGAFIQRSTGNTVVYAEQLLSSIIMHSGSKGHYVLECTINGAGSALTEIENQLNIPTEEAEAQIGDWLLQAENPPLFLNGIAGLGTPFWVPDFPSTFIGEGEPWEKIVAVSESIIFLIRVNLLELEKVTKPIEKIILAGGLASIDGLCHRLSNLTQLPIYRPAECEATARGLAFILAGCPTKSPESQAGEWFYPQADSSLNDRYHRWRLKMDLALNLTP